jgi:hypothetical protein
MNHKPNEFPGDSSHGFFPDRLALPGSEKANLTLCFLLYLFIYVLFSSAQVDAERKHYFIL